ncbi:hypothetical protein LWI28_024529 [Acer negundo]|uniref:Uncharacterized protein n=1 Tax=Acer negundo TaxID=4023 RepID=A0AAD5JJ87_ACENE|nr:hypothetical protein LWI28_024529 [Acer negundo]
MDNILKTFLTFHERKCIANTVVDQEYDDNQDHSVEKGGSLIQYGIRAGNCDFRFTDCSDERITSLLKQHEALNTIEAGAHRETESQQLSAMATTSIGWNQR